MRTFTGGGFFMSNVIVFIAGLNGDPRTWSRVSAQIGSTPAGFAVSHVEYSAAKTSPSPIEISANKLLTDLELKYSHHDAIFLVGYSLGGLIAREVCRQLLMGDASKDALLRKIKAVIAVGDPLDGAAAWRFPKLQPTWNAVLRAIPWTTKVNQIASPEQRLAEYQGAIDLRLMLQAEDETRSVTRPKIVHIKIEDDTTALATPKFYTIDDIDGGTIGGTHSKFAEDSKSAEHVADLLLRRIRDVQTAENPLHAAGRASTKPPVSDSVKLPPYLILIACSRTKNTGGVPGYDGEPIGWINERFLQDRIVAKRSHVYFLLKDQKIDDAFEAGRNRLYSASNKALGHGPDLGGVKAKGDECSYLPAWKRYCGQTYADVGDETWAKHLSERKAGVLIMSGLYGLIDAAEKIQDYDVHLSDTDTGGQSVKAMWAELYTDTIGHYVSQAYRGKRVKIFNLLADLEYVTAIECLQLPRDKCSVYHLASPTRKGKLASQNAGRWRASNAAPCVTDDRRWRYYRVAIRCVARSKRASRRTVRRTATSARPPEPTGAAPTERLQRAVGVEYFDASAGLRVNVEERLMSCVLSGVGGGGLWYHHAALSESSARAKPRM
jgi:pimeloyl-ACP methyl ester carboxylesterase